MILSFSKDQFKEKILAGTKIHTIRADVHNRWKVGMKMHMWRGSPRNTGAKVKPHQFAEMECTNIQYVRIYPHSHVEVSSNIKFHEADILIAQALFGGLLEFAISDGFEDVEEFWDWFNLKSCNDGDFDGREFFSGKLLHWTNTEY